MKTSKKVLAIILAIVMVFSTVQMASFAESPDGDKIHDMDVLILSDIHYYPDEYYDNDDLILKPNLALSSGNLLATALETIAATAKEGGQKYVLVPGDLTKNGEYQSHLELAQILEKFEADTGLQILVVPGNHDINNKNAVNMAGDKPQDVRTITAQEFREVYKNLGYDLATAEFADEHGTQSGYLSYIAKLDDGYQVVALDTAIYEFGEPVKADSGGQITPTLMNWVERETAKITAVGDEPILMQHHAIVPHALIGPSITQDFVLKEYVEKGEKLASLGINFAFTGHLHASDTACLTNDDGETIYDFAAPSIIDYPNYFGMVEFSTYENGKTYAEYNTCDFDAIANFTFDGKTYENSSFKNTSFALSFGTYENSVAKADAEGFFVNLLVNKVVELTDYFDEYDTILDALKGEFDLDLEELLSGLIGDAIGDGINIFGYTVFSMDNIMWFIEDLLEQIFELYVNDPAKLQALAEEVVPVITEFKVSDIVPTKFANLGIGEGKEYGTVGDLLLELVAYYYTGNEDCSDDAFLQDVFTKIDDSSLMKEFFPVLLDFVVNDLAQELLLGKLEIRVDKLLNDDFIMNKLGEGINFLLEHLLRNDFTYLNLVKIVFSLDILPYSSIQDLLDKLVLNKYLTDSVYESLSLTLSYVAKDFSNDVNPKPQGDSDVIYSSENLPVVATSDNYRLPTMISVTMGEDSQTQAGIRWYSKYSLAGDIEIYKADSEPTFTGTATENAVFTIDKTTELVDRSFPGIDLGFFGFLDYHFDMNMHTVNLKNLEPDSTYYFKVGNAQKDWWSDVGTITTADGSNEVTFIHTTDPQSQNALQYDRAWKNVIDQAYTLYPDTDFMINTGDIIDTGDNNKQWQAVFDSASKDLMNTFFMPTTGNHEESGENVTVNQFVIPNMPEQDTGNGVYYSFEYNNVYFAVLNTNALDGDELSKEQIDWLTQDIAKTDATWKFVAFHKAIYSQGSHTTDSDVVAMRMQLGELMPKLDIDMVFQGHDHVYMRTDSLISNQKEGNDKAYLEFNGKNYLTQVMPEGTSYVITGTSGIKFYDQSEDYVEGGAFPRPESIMALDLPMFAGIQIKDKVMYFDAYSVADDGTEVVDSFAIQKDLSQGNKVGDYTPTDEDLDENDGASSFLKEVFETLEKIIRVILNLIELYVLRRPV